MKNLVTPEGRDAGTGPKDQLLVQRALAGERSAVDDVVGRLSCAVRFVYRLNRGMGYHLPTEGLEDVVQQVYVAIWPRLGDYAGSSALETWVYGFCRNCLRAEFRRRMTRSRGLHGQASVLDLAVERAVERVDDTAPVERVAQMESLDLLQEELDQLDPADREIVELRHLQDWSFEQIARQKNLPPSTVKDRCYRAMDRIRKRLKRRHGGA